MLGVRKGRKCSSVYVFSVGGESLGAFEVVVVYERGCGNRIGRFFSFRVAVNLFFSFSSTTPLPLLFLKKHGHGVFDEADGRRVNEKFLSSTLFLCGVFKF